MRKKTRWHVALMLSAIAIDIGLVLTLAIRRGAVGTALEFKLGTLPQLHILFSTLAILLYLPVAWIGWTLFKSRVSAPSRKRLHMRFGWAAFVLRSLGFLLMFSLLKSPSDKLNNAENAPAERPGTTMDAASQSRPATRSLDRSR